MRLGTMRNSLRKKFTRLRSDESGNVLILTAAALLPMLALIGSAVDISMAYMGRGKLQNACDSAVLAGRQAMVGTFFTDKARAEANKFFEFNYDEGTLRAQDLNFQVE
ncbi:MAG: pilus assembly protein TadG, partial [Citromicrobium sp.]